VVVPPAEWKVRLPGRLPAYISVERYEANQERLRQNQSRPTAPGTPRSGACLLSRLIRCGRCGGRMQARYPRAGQPAYACSRQHQRGTPPGCPGVRAAVVDEVVAEQVLLALEPASVQLSLQALADVAQERQRLGRHWQQQLERARYEAQDAERRYRLVDPANRLVARTLEQRWEEALRAQRQLEEEYDRFLRRQPPELTEAERQRLLALAQDIPALWRDGRTTPAQRKEVIGCLVDQVVVTVAERSERASVAIHWAGGFVSEHAVRRPVAGYERLSNSAELKGRIMALREAGHSAAGIAARLNAEGWRPPKRRGTFTKDMVSQWLSRRGLNGRPPAAARPRRGEWRLKDLAARLGLHVKTLGGWRRRGWLAGRWVAGAGCWLVWADAEEVRRLRRLVAFGRRHPRGPYPRDLLVPKQRKGKGC
jgi:Recombinase zinc beta ribbon domain